MKKLVFSLSFMVLFAFVVTTGSSCNRGVGCPSTENLGPKTNRKGGLSTKKRAKSGLTPKRMKKRRRRH